MNWNDLSFVIEFVFLVTSLLRLAVYFNNFNTLAYSWSQLCILKKLACLVSFEREILSAPTKFFFQIYTYFNCDMCLLSKTQFILYFKNPSGNTTS